MNNKKAIALVSDVHICAHTVHNLMIKAESAQSFQQKPCTPITYIMTAPFHLAMASKVQYSCVVDDYFTK